MTIRHNVKRAVYKLSNRGLMVETRIDVRGERKRVQYMSSWLNILASREVTRRRKTPVTKAKTYSAHTHS